MSRTSIKDENTLNMLDVMIVEELDKDHPDTTQVAAWTSQREEIALRLDSSVTAGAAVAETDVSSSIQEAIMPVPTAQDLGLSDVTAPTPDAPAGTAPTAQALGLSTVKRGDAIYHSLTKEDLKRLVQPILNDDGTPSHWTYLASKDSIFDDEHMIEIYWKSRSEIKKFARGLALYEVGAVQPDGTVIGTTGNAYTPHNGKCFSTRYNEVSNFDGTTFKTKREIDCGGIKRYRGGENGPQPIKNDDGSVKEDDRCLHMCSIEFHLNKWVIFRNVDDNGRYININEVCGER